MQPRYKYMVLRHKGVAGRTAHMTDDELVVKLDELGSEGWQIVSGLGTERLLLMREVSVE